MQKRETYLIDDDDPQSELRGISTAVKVEVIQYGKNNKGLKKMYMHF